MIDLAVAIQNHPDRIWMAKTLVKDHVPMAQIHTDMELTGAWYALKRILNAYRETAFTHVVVVHDDVYPCKDFYDEVCRVISYRPDQIFSLFKERFWKIDSSRVQNSKYYKEYRAGNSWFHTTFFMSQCIVYPVRLIGRMLDWLEDYGDDGPMFKGFDPKFRHNSDTSRICGFLRENGFPIITTIPCFVEHLAPLSSTAKTTEGVLVQSHIEAMLFTGDVSMVDWTRGL